MAGNKLLSESRQATQEAEVTPELVRRVADKVYARLLKDLRIEKERLRQQGNSHV